MLIGCIAVIFTGTAFAESELYTVTANVQFGQSEARSMLTDINTFRKSSDAWYWNDTDTAKVTVSGLSDLQYDYGLEAVAMQRAAELAVFYEHTRPDGSRCFTAYPFSCRAYENIAYGTSYLGTADSIFTSWREDDEPYAWQGHRRAMLAGDVSYIGIGHASVNGVEYWVQEFANKPTNEQSTTALNGTKTVSIDFRKDSQVGANSIVFSWSFSDDSTIELKAGASVAVPAISAQFAQTDYKYLSFSGSPSSIGLSVSPSSVARIENGRIIGVAPGTATLSAAVFGETKTVPVRVLQNENAVSAPVISKQPTNVTVKSGNIAKFTVGVVSGSPVTYQWQYSYDNGNTWSNAGTDGSKTATLTSAPASATTAKLIYRCKVTNSVGSTYSGNVRFYVSDIAPVINKQPVNVTIKSGKTAQFTVGVISATNVTYQWQYSYDNGNTWSNAGTAGAKTKTVISAPASATTAKLIYRCKVTNSVGSTYSGNVRFYVSDIAPVINKQPVNVTIKSGKTAQFTVGVISATNVTYQWQYSYDNGNTWSNASTAGAKTKTVTSAPASATTAKLIYRCKVTNSVGSTYSGNARFYVSDIAPVINKQPVNMTVKSGKTAQFTVGVISATNVTYQWQYSYDNGNTWSNAGTAGAKTATLTSAQASSTTAKLIYRCKIKNSVGTIYTNSVRMIVS